MFLTAGKDALFFGLQDLKNLSNYLEYLFLFVSYMNSYFTTD